MGEDVDMKVAHASDVLLDLVGEIVKLGVLLTEIPEAAFPELEDRLDAFMIAVHGLPIESTTTAAWLSTPGEA